MKVGDYARTYDGVIGKIIDDNLAQEETRYEIDYNNKLYYYRQIAKSNSNIIDLIGVGDLMFIDISPDYCGGIVVPRIAETQAELDEFISKIQKGEYILEGVLTKEQIENQVYWLGLDKEEK